MKNPFIKQKTWYERIAKAYEKRTRTTKKYLAKKFRFSKRWQRATAAYFRRIGAKIEHKSPNWLKKVARMVAVPFRWMHRRIKAFLARRPHRSFRRTRRRDYKRSLAMPGYWSFTNSVRAMLWKNKFLFGGIALTYLIIMFAVNSFGQQEAYKNLSDALYEFGGETLQGNWGKVAGSGILLVSSITTGLTPNPTSAQTVISVLAAFFVWLATVWALRNVMAGRKVKVRDAVYSSGGPVVPTILVSFVLVVQILPLSIAILIYNAAIVSGLIEGVVSMLAWAAIVLLGVLSLYWMVSTLFALIVVTLPGMYPWRAIQNGGDLVVGRRLRILFRIVWMALIVVVLWAIIAIPIILFDDWIKKVWTAIDWLPLVPLTMMILSSLTIVFVSSYVYMLYRKVVSDEAGPA